MEQVAVPLPPPQQAAPRRWWITGVALIGVLVVVGGALLATKIFSATRSTFADSMPPESAAFFHVDVLNVVRSGELDRMLQAFDAQNDQGDVIENTVNEIDRLLLAENAQFDFSNDIVPWLGRGVGISVTTFGGAQLEPEFIAAIDVRDTGEFERFFPKLQATIEEQQGPMLEREYQGVTTYISDDAVFALSKKVFLIGSNDFAMKDAIDAQLGVSLADVEDFATTLELLPENRVLTGWINTAKYADEFFNAYGTLTDPDFYDTWVNPEEAPASYGFSGRFVDSGLQFDFAALYPEGATALDVWRDSELGTAELAPNSTLGFLAAPPFVETYVESLREGFIEEFEDIRQQGVEDYGIDFDADFLSLLDGKFSFVATWEPGGLLDQQWDVPVGAAAYIETSEQDRLRNTLARFFDIGADFSGLEIIDPYGDPELYDGFDDYDGTVIPFGVDYGFLMAATDRSLLEDMFAADGNKLADEPAYQAAADQLDGMEHVFYVDFGKINELIESLDPEDTSEFLGPLETVLVGYQIDDNVFSGTALFSIDY